MVYARTLGGRERSFLVSGALWKDSLVLQDHESGTLFSQVTGEALSGPLAGERLEAIPAVQTTWGKWKAAHPETELLRKERRVTKSGYEAYHKDPDRFGISRAKRAVARMPGKTLVHGAVVDGEAIAARDSDLAPGSPLRATFGERKVEFVRGEDGGVRAFLLPERREVPVTAAYWFAWISFYPGSAVLD